MSNDMFEEDEKDNVQLRPDEINGKQNLFHSLPKELQAWHTTLYASDKEGNLDTNAISDALLNGHMWKVVLNGTQYGIGYFISLLGAFILMRIFSEHVFTQIFIFLGFVSVSLYLAYQFYWYAFLNAQGVGPSSIRYAKAITRPFYMTTIPIFMSLTIIIFFFYFFGESLMILLFSLIETWKESVLFHHESPLKIYLFVWVLAVDIHNFFAEIVSTNGKSYLSFMVLIPTFIIIHVSLMYIMNKIGFNYKRKMIVEAVRDYIFSSGYPIDKAQKTITEWRKKHSV